jgi:hypothetical protein
MNSQPRHIEHAARLASRRPAFMAYYLVRYRAIEGLEESELASLLGLGQLPTCLTNLAFAPAPDPLTGTFGAEVRRLADAFGASPVGLARVIRRVVAIGRLAGVNGDSDAGLLAAARDREDETATGGANTGGPSDQTDSDPGTEV